MLDLPDILKKYLNSQAYFLLRTEHDRKTQGKSLKRFTIENTKVFPHLVLDHKIP